MCCEEVRSVTDTETQNSFLFFSLLPPRLYRTAYLYLGCSKVGQQQNWKSLLLGFVVVGESWQRMWSFASLTLFGFLHLLLWLLIPSLSFSTYSLKRLFRQGNALVTFTVCIFVLFFLFDQSYRPNFVCSILFLPNCFWHSLVWGLVWDSPCIPLLSYVCTPMVAFWKSG